MKIKLFIVGGVLLAGAVALPLVHRVAYSHCEIPCGIYGDKNRIDVLYEHIATVNKSMVQINALAGKGDAQSLNQATRWVGNKEQHATEIQHIVTQYFLTQRVKAKPAGTPEHRKYMTQLESLHGMLVGSMKCKQTVSTDHTQTLRKHLDRFVGSYFTGEDLKHIREHHGDH